MILPWGNSEPEKVIEYIISLSDESFSELMKNPIVIQAKIFYSNIRKMYK